LIPCETHLIGKIIESNNETAHLIFGSLSVTILPTKHLFDSNLEISFLIKSLKFSAFSSSSYLIALRKLFFCLHLILILNIWLFKPHFGFQPSMKNEITCPARFLFKLTSFSFPSSSTLFFIK
jgi:hypothetical protein